MRTILGFGVMLLVGLLSGCSGDDTATTAFPGSDRILAQSTQGGWANIDFLAEGDPVEEAQRCVGSRPEEEAVACFAFPSRTDYSTSRPEAAGSFTGPLCWSGRWQRNKLGSESGTSGPPGRSACPGYSEEVANPAEITPVVPAPSGPIEVSITFEIERDGRGRARFSGKTNLPDGTSLSFSMKGLPNRSLRQSKGTVRAGAFTSEWFGSPGGQGMPDGRYEVGVTVPFYNVQPESVKAILGSKLDLMEGPLVHWMNPEMHSLGKVASMDSIVVF